MGLHPQGRPFSRSYGANLPSSFTRVLSSALGSSPHLPVSVLVRTLCLPLRLFLDEFQMTSSQAVGLAARAFLIARSPFTRRTLLAISQAVQEY